MFAKSWPEQGSYQSNCSRMSLSALSLSRCKIDSRATSVGAQGRNQALPPFTRVLHGEFDFWSFSGCNEFLFERVKPPFLILANQFADVLARGAPVSRRNLPFTYCFKGSGSEMFSDVMAMPSYYGSS